MKRGAMLYLVLTNKEMVGKVKLEGSFVQWPWNGGIQDEFMWVKTPPIWKQGWIFAVSLIKIWSLIKLMLLAWSSYYWE